MNTEEAKQYLKKKLVGRKISLEAARELMNIDDVIYDKANILYGMEKKKSPPIEYKDD